MSPQSIIRRPKILVIDDDPIYRSLITSMLREKYLIFVANDGEEGFRKALTHPPDAAIIDINMPGWDGLKTLRVIRQTPSLAHLPLMMLTSDASRETVLTALQSGASDYLLKTSFTKAEFHKKLARLLNESASRPTSGISRNRLESILDRPAQKANEDSAADPTSSPETESIPAAHPTAIAAESAFPADASASDSQLQEIMDAWE